MKLFKGLSLLLFFLLFLFVIKSSVLAASFTTDYRVDYKVAEDASTKVSFNVSLVNSTSDYYASSYKIILGFKDIKNISAYDEDGSITPQVEQIGDGTSVNLVFNKKVVGIGNKLNFGLSFNTSEIAQHTGHVWELNIPGISKQNDFANFNVHVSVPNSAGKLMFVKPAVATINAGNNELSFNRDQLGNSGISITYGDYQIYKFNLAYHLSNKNLFPIKTEIALPPNTNYQEVEINDISPKPLSMRKDADGNWIAEYYIPSMRNVNPKVVGYAKVILNPMPQELSQAQINLYTAPLSHWESEDASIRKLARSLKTPRAIYDYTVSHLSYDFSRISDSQVRLGAAGVLKNPNSAVCLEFTDLFVALSRAAGIPARAVEGYANTRNSKERPLSLFKDVLHAWPEYYDFEKKSWIMVDPTWGNTTRGVDYFNILDFDHLAFVIKGSDSEYPVPAGGYKLSGQEKIKDVSVEAVSTFPPSTKTVETRLVFKSNYLSYAPIKGFVILTNNGNSQSYPQNLNLTSQGLIPQENHFKIGSLLPNETVTIPLSYKNDGLFEQGTKDIVLENNDQQVVTSIKISLLSYEALLALGGVLIVFGVILSIIVYRSRRLSFFGRKR